MGAALGVDLGPVRLFRDSPLPVHLGAQALARGSEIHLAPGTGPPGRRLLAHELAHVVQQHERPVAPTTRVAGIAVSADAELERAADSQAHRLAGALPKRSARACVDLAAGPPGEIVAQLWPPESVEQADRELEQVEARLFGRGLVVRWFARGRWSSPGLELLQASRAVLKVLESVRTLSLQIVGMDGDEARQLIDLWLKLRSWKDAEARRQRGFGFPRFSPAAYFPPPSPLQDAFSFNPFRPELHNLPFDSVPPGQTHERLGSDVVVRYIDEDELRVRREGSRAYQRPPRQVRLYEEPTFPPDIYRGESTELDPRRVGIWAGQRRGELATAGGKAGSGEKWRGQKAVMGMSAAEVVHGFNARAGGGMVIREDVPYQWLHLFAFSIGGLHGWDPQDQQNFVVGTQQANLYHNIFEAIAKDLAKTRKVIVTCEALAAICEDWRLYRRLRYSFRLAEVRFPLPIVVREIGLFDTPQVHVGDMEGMRELILAELGLATPAFRGAVDQALTQAAAAGPHSRLEPLRGGYATEVVPTDEERDAMEIAPADEAQDPMQVVPSE
jgi:hypothetical protein